MEEKYILSDRGKVYYWIKESNSVFAKNLIFLPGLTANHHLFLISRYSTFQKIIMYWYGTLLLMENQDLT